MKGPAELTQESAQRIQRKIRVSCLAAALGCFLALSDEPSAKLVGALVGCAAFACLSACWRRRSFRGASLLTIGVSMVNGVAFVDMSAVAFHWPQAAAVYPVLGIGLAVGWAIFFRES